MLIVLIRCVICLLCVLINECINLSFVSHCRLEKLQTQETSGILDTKWLAKPLNDSAVLGAVTSDGELKIYFLREKLLVESTSYISSPEKLCLSLDWSLEDENSHIVVSDSGGQITLCKFNEGTSELCQVLQWSGHQYEAWITAFNAWNSSIVYSDMRWVSAAFSAILHMNTSLQLAAMMKRFMFGTIET